MNISKETLIKNLNKDLSNELAAIIQYTVYASKTTGINRLQLADFFSQEVADEQKHALFLANKITTLGGEPTTVPAAIPQANGNVEMLKSVLKAEEEAIKNYTQRVKEAEAYGDKALAINLEDLIMDESNHAEESAKLLRGI